MSNGKIWKPMHTAILQAMHATHHDHEIAERTGHATVTVFYRRQHLGLAPFRPTRYGSFLDIPPASMAAIRKAAKMAV